MQEHRTKLRPSQRQTHKLQRIEIMDETAIPSIWNTPPSHGHGGSGNTARGSGRKGRSGEQEVAGATLRQRARGRGRSLGDWVRRLARGRRKGEHRSGPRTVPRGQPPPKSHRREPSPGTGSGGLRVPAAAPAPKGTERVYRLPPKARPWPRLRAPPQPALEGDGSPLWRKRSCSFSCSGHAGDGDGGAPALSWTEPSERELALACLAMERAFLVGGSGGGSSSGLWALPCASGTTVLRSERNGAADHRGAAAARTAKRMR